MHYSTLVMSLIARWGSAKRKIGENPREPEKQRAGEERSRREEEMGEDERRKS